MVKLECQGKLGENRIGVACVHDWSNAHEGFDALSKLLVVDVGNPELDCALRMPNVCYFLH